MPRTRSGGRVRKLSRGSSDAMPDPGTAERCRLASVGAAPPGKRPARLRGCPGGAAACGAAAAVKGCSTAWISACGTLACLVRWPGCGCSTFRRRFQLVTRRLLLAAESCAHSTAWTHLRHCGSCLVLRRRGSCLVLRLPRPVESRCSGQRRCRSVAWPVRLLWLLLRCSWCRCALLCTSLHGMLTGSRWLQERRP